MKNYEIEAAWKFHNGTKHPNGNLLNRFHSYSPSSRPPPYKVYKNQDQIHLISDKIGAGMPTLEAISKNTPYEGEIVLDITTLSKILFLSGGITKTIKFPPPLGRVEFRAASCTGALYHIEIYVACNNVNGLKAGIYHYDPRSNSLTILREGSYRQAISEATAHEPAASNASLTLVFTDVFARNAIKYQAREYRHAFWDCGTIISNSLATATSYKIPYKLILGFVDSKINELLGLDDKEEAAIAMLSLGCSEHEVSALGRTLTTPKAEPLGFYTDLGAINEIHKASSLTSFKEVEDWRRSAETKEQTPAHQASLLSRPDLNGELEETIIRRGSTRIFSHEAISSKQLSTILGMSTLGITSDFTRDGIMNDIYLIVNAVVGIDAGKYHYNRQDNLLEPLGLGNFRETAGRLGLDQRLPHDASVALFFMADLKAIMGRLGNRGYRAALLDASITAGKMYLASYSLNLGATGLTFYDDEVTEFFFPHAKDKNTTFMLAIGKKSSARVQQ